MTKKLNTKTMITAALLVALQIVFVRLLSYDAGSVRISLGFLPVAIAGMIFGPWGGGAVAVIADVVGMLLFSRGGVYFPLFTISEFLYGFGFGMMLHNREFSLLRISVFVSIQFIIINLFLTSIWLYLYYIIIVGKTQGYWIIFSGRLFAALINLPVQIIGINLICRYLKNPIKKLGR